MRFIVFILFVFIGGTTAAQGFGGGLFCGISTSQVSGDAAAGFDKAGIYAGVCSFLNLNEKNAIQLELSFIQKGSRKNPKPNLGIYNKYLLRLNYVEIPLIYRMKFNYNLSFEAGPSLGILVFSREYDQSGIISNRLPFQNQDISMNFGGNYEINEHLKFNVRFSNSILKIRDHQSGEVYWFNRGQYNSVLAFSLNYQI